MTAINVELKPGVSLAGLQPQMNVALLVVHSVYSTLGQDLTITSGAEGRHQRGSKHYTGQALDFRVRHVPRATRRLIRARVSDSLGADFDVVLKGGRGPHLHVEWDPKNPVNL